MKSSATFLLSVICILTVQAQKPDFILSAPAGDRFTSIDKQGVTVIPNGRLITPAGKCYTVAPHPYGLAINPDGNIAVTANSGIQPLSITILRNLQSDAPGIQQVPPGPATDDGVLASVFMGIAVSPDNRLVYVAGGQENKIFIFDIQTGEKQGFIDCAFKDAKHDYSHGYIGDLVLSRDGKTIYAVDQIGFRMIVADAVNRKLISSAEVGRYPFGICLSPDEKQVFVANVGMYKYSLVKKKKQGEWKNGVLDYPAFAYGSEEAEKGIKNDTLDIPGLGSMDSDESFSVWTVDVQNPGRPKVTAKIKTGTRVGQMVEGIPAVGGSSPNSLVTDGRYVFCSNGNNDNISVIDARKKAVVKNISLCPDKRLQKLRGIIPFGLALSPDGKRLYVAESGLNAIGVIDTKTLQVIGHIPAGWFPAKLKVTADGRKLVVANAKGFGSGPNGGAAFMKGPEGTYIGSLMKGTVEVLDIPSDEMMKSLTQKVIDNNFLFREPKSDDFAGRSKNPVPLYPGEKSSPIKHIVFISKENRTYDEIFGQVVKSNGDASIARYGANVSFTNGKKDQKVNFATVMPNHLQLANRYAIADNF
ncbi:MAG TPA: YncE family protein, partial [Bacteroidales bacterium]|nr:YncE family protein [Bacteroidales bacterium]